MKIENAMTVFKVLPKTNCRECGARTCLAFAGMVVSAKHPLAGCPHLAPDVVALQEADGPSGWSGNFDHVATLARQAADLGVLTLRGFANLLAERIASAREEPDFMTPAPARISGRSAFSMSSAARARDSRSTASFAWTWAS